MLMCLGWKNLHTDKRARAGLAAAAFSIIYGKRWLFAYRTKTSTKID